METDKHLNGIIIFLSALVAVLSLALLIKKENQPIVKVKHIYHNTVIHSKPNPRDCVPSNGTNW